MGNLYLSLVCGVVLCAVTINSQYIRSGNYITRGSYFPQATYPSYQSIYPSYQSTYPSHQTFPSYGSRFMNYRNDDMFPDYNRPDNSWDSPDSNSYGINQFGGYYRYD